MSDDPLIAMRAGIDQAIASFPEIARALYGAYAAYITVGFTDSQAMELTTEWYRFLLTQQS